MELEISQTDAVRPIALIDIDAKRVCGRVIAVRVIGEAGAVGGCGEIPVVGEFVKDADIFRCLPVEPAAGLRALERRINAARKELKRRARDNGISAVLLEAFRIDEEKELVLDDRAAEAASELVALELGRHGSRKIGESGAVVAELVKRLAVIVVGPGTGRDIHRA